MTKHSNLPSKRRRKDFHNTSQWYHSLANLTRQIHKQQEKQIHIEEEEIKIEDESFDGSNERRRE